MTNYVPSQHQHPSSNMMMVMTAEAVQAHIKKKYMAAEGIRGTWNMHWLMTRSSVTCTPRYVTVTSLHTGQVIQTVLFHLSLSKSVTDVMVITREVVALQYQLVSGMLIDMLPPIKVGRVAKISNQYNQVPHLTQDTTWESDNSQLNITNESHEVSLFPAGDHKPQFNPLTCPKV